MVNRVEPKLSSGAFKTYQILSPRATHQRGATCSEVDCQAQAHGWRTEVDEASMLGQMQAHYIRQESGRDFVETRDEHGMTVFTFTPGQRCFARHMVSLDRPELFLVRNGDHRGDPAGGRPFRHRRAEDGVDDCAGHQERLAGQ